MFLVDTAPPAAPASPSLYDRFLRWDWDFGDLWNHFLYLFHYYVHGYGWEAGAFFIFLTIALLWSWSFTHGLINMVFGRGYALVVMVGRFVFSEAWALFRVVFIELLIARFRDSFRWVAGHFEQTDEEQK